MEAVSLQDIANASKARYTRVEDMVVAALREAILAGVLKPGEKLHQEKLAVALGVSRLPVRAAIARLDAEGLTVSEPHRGSVVRVLKPDELRETYELRIVLETFALNKAIDRITPQGVQELSDLADQIDGDVSGELWLSLTEAFYQKLYLIAEQPLTAEMISKLRANVGRYWLSLKVLQHEGSTHRVIVDAIRANDPAQAEMWITDHLTKVSVEMQRRMNEQLEATAQK